MPRVYYYDFHRYHTPSFTVANEVKHDGSGMGSGYFKASYKEGSGIIDSALNIGKTAINFAKDNKELISAIGSIAGAASQISRAEESAKQLDAIRRISDIRQRNIKDSTPSAVPTPSAPDIEKKIESISKNYSSGRGMRKKKGGVLKSF